jgi:hypothetical protein
MGKRAGKHLRPTATAYHHIIKKLPSQLLPSSSHRAGKKSASHRQRVASCRQKELQRESRAVNTDLFLVNLLLNQPDERRTPPLQPAGDKELHGI